MVNVIKDIFLRLGLDKTKLHDQCYDGCITMMGKKGVATLIKRNVQTLTLSTHCYAHSLNLACKDWIKNSTVVSNSLDTSYEITELVKFSPKRDYTFVKFTRRSITKTKKSLVVRCKPSLDCQIIIVNQHLRDITKCWKSSGTGV